MSSVSEAFTAGQGKDFNEPGDFFRLLATTSPVDIAFYKNGKKFADITSIEAGYAEYFRGQENNEFDRVRITSPGAQTVQFVTRYGSDVRYDRGASSVTGTVELGAASLAALEQINVRPEAYTAGNLPVVLAAGPVNIVPAGSNVNGYSVDDLQAMGVATANGAGMLLAKATAPTSMTDGDALAFVGLIASGASSSYYAGRVSKIMVPAGKGIWFYGSAGSVYTASNAFATVVGKAL